MAITKTIRILIQVLKVCELDEDEIVGTVLLLKTDEQAQKLIGWIDQNPTATTSEIIYQALCIAEMQDKKK